MLSTKAKLAELRTTRGAGARSSSGVRFQILSPSPPPDLARALLPGTRHRNTGPEGTRRFPQQRRARAGPCPSCPALARTCAPGAAGEAATSPRGPLGARRASQDSITSPKPRWKHRCEPLAAAPPSQPIARDYANRR